jgi:hypothetical protein
MTSVSAVRQCAELRGHSGSGVGRGRGFCSNPCGRLDALAQQSFTHLRAVPLRATSPVAHGSRGFFILRPQDRRRPNFAGWVKSIMVPTIVSAVPVPVIVNPTCSGVSRRPPEGAPPVPTDNPPDN